ncbi:MAG: HAD hydrolase-like protein [Oscillospiraceae bacterium]|jgi:phosphoglycolate phosphatase|nr:HAD hydrolase-like protein [Oscillospiraceae bacterium]
MKADLIIFDFDGTILNSERGIANCVRHALASVGVEEHDDSKIRRFIGPPLFHAFQELYGFDDETAARLVDVYRERYRPVGYRECEVYEGVLPMLAALRETGVKTAVASAKPEEFVVKISRELGFAHLFDALIGSRLQDTQADKTRLLQRAMEETGFSGAHNVVMVGDSRFDMLAAKNAGAFAVGVEYGFGSRAELEESGADYIAKTVRDLERCLLSLINIS